MEAWPAHSAQCTADETQHSRQQQPAQQTKRNARNTVDNSSSQHVDKTQQQRPAINRTCTGGLAGTSLSLSLSEISELDSAARRWSGTPQGGAGPIRLPHALCLSQCLSASLCQPLCLSQYMLLRIRLRPPTTAGGRQRGCCPPPQEGRGGAAHHRRRAAEGVLHLRRRAAESLSSLFCFSTWNFSSSILRISLIYGTISCAHICHE